MQQKNATPAFRSKLRHYFCFVSAQHHGVRMYAECTTFTNYWSATTGAYSTDYAWRVDFGYGDLDINNKSNSYYVRAVRAAQ